MLSSSFLSEELELDPDAVRRRASSITGCHEVSPVSLHDATVCTFLVGCSSSNSINSNRGESNCIGSTANTLARVTIYCDTGTIATARVSQGQVRHCFRRAVSSLDTVERCLRQPAELPCIDWKLLELSNCRTERTTGNRSNRMARPSVTNVDKNLELLDVGLAILQSEKEKLQQHLAVLEQQKQHIVSQESSTDHMVDYLTLSASTNQTGTNDSRTSANTNTGMEFQFSLAAGPMKHVDQCLQDIREMNKMIRGVATNGVGTVFLYGNGGVAYTPSIPRALYQRLSQLRHSKVHANRPSYVSLGTRERYFVAFHDGSYTYKGPKPLDRECRKLIDTPRSVAFGSSYDTFLIVYHDGTWICTGKSIPAALEEKLPACGNELACINLGPYGEWFLRSTDGRVGWGGVSCELDEAIQELVDAGHVISFIDFGENGSYFISYD